MRLLLLAIVSLLPVQAAADVVSLTPEQAEVAKEAGAQRNAHAAKLGVEPRQDRDIHGEVGFAVSTGGYTSVYGTAVLPIGSDGFAAISIADDHYGHARRHR